MNTKSALGMMAGMASIAGMGMSKNRGNLKTSPFMKTCHQCGCEYDNRGKICGKCYKKNGKQFIKGKVNEE